MALTRLQKLNQDREAEKKTREVDANQAEAIPTSSTKLTDINNDCLAHIFQYLNLVDLVNVADASKHMRQGVELAFNWKYGRKMVLFRDVKVSKDQLCNVDSDYIRLCDVTFCLRFFRCLGHVIKALEINFTKLDLDHRAVVDRYINRYCMYSKIDWNTGYLESCTPITKLFINNMLWEPELLERVSNDVKTLRIQCDRYLSFLQVENIHFKNLHTFTLRFGYSRKEEFPKVQLSFDQLTDLTISTNCKWNENFIDFLAGLKSLKFLFLCGFSPLRFYMPPQIISDKKLDGVLSGLTTFIMKCECSTNQIIRLFNRCKSVEEFDIELDANSDLISLQSRLPNEWQASNTNGFTKMRRTTGPLTKQ